MEIKDCEHKVFEYSGLDSEPSLSKYICEKCGEVICVIEDAGTGA